MIQDLTISYACNGIETTLTINDDHYDNMPYNLADMFEKVIRESGANPQMVIENLKVRLSMSKRKYGYEFTEHHILQRTIQKTQFRIFEERL